MINNVKDILYGKIFKALNEDLNMVLSDDDFEEPEIDLDVHISNIQKNILSDCILKKCKEQDGKALKELINNNWDGKTPIFFASDKNIQEVVQFSIRTLGNKANLNWVDTSNVTNMHEMFSASPFNGDISGWDVSKVTDMSRMFKNSMFTGDISKWDVSSVTNMGFMFYYSRFNGDISSWDVSSVTKMIGMFANSRFNGEISKWNVSTATDMSYMFTYSKFNQDISSWNISKGIDTTYIFYNCPIKNEYKPKIEEK